MYDATGILAKILRFPQNTVEQLGKEKLNLFDISFPEIAKKSVGY